MGIFELRVWRGDSLQSWRFSVVFGVNIPPIYRNVINVKKITLKAFKDIKVNRKGFPPLFSMLTLLRN